MAWGFYCPMLWRAQGAVYDRGPLTGCLTSHEISTGHISLLLTIHERPALHHSAQLKKLQEASAEAVARLEAAAEKEAEAAAALEEADKRLRALTADRSKMKDFEELEAQHVQVGMQSPVLHSSRLWEKVPKVCSAIAQVLANCTSV